MERGELQSGRIAAGIVAAQRPSLGDDRREDPRDRVTGLDPGGRVGSRRDDTLHRPVVPIEDAERDVRRAKQVARGHAHALKQPVGVPLGREFQTRY